MTPADAIIKERRIAGSQAGNPAAGKPTIRALAGAGKAYAIYLKGGTRAELVLELPANEYKAEWVDTKNRPRGKGRDVSPCRWRESLFVAGISEATAKRWWTYARSWLLNEINPPKG